MGRVRLPSGSTPFEPPREVRRLSSLEVQPRFTCCTFECVAGGRGIVLELVGLEFAERLVGGAGHPG